MGEGPDADVTPCGAVVGHEFAGDADFFGATVARAPSLVSEPMLMILPPDLRAIMRRAAERPYVKGLTQVGIRNVSSTARDGYEAAREMGADILSVRQARALGAQGVVDRIPKGARVYVTIDIDGFCPSIAPGTGTPSHGGFLYYEVLEMLQGIARSHEVVGIDLVEVAPDYDHSGSTSILAAQVLLNFLGFIFHARGAR